MNDFEKSQKQFITQRANGTMRIQTINDEPSKTQQQFADECDINNIMKKYADTGEFRHVTSKTGVYADFTQITDYQEMLHAVQYAQDAFSSLPAEVRKRFRNDPGELLAFIQDDKNYDEALLLGLVEKRDNGNANVNKNELNEPNTNAKATKREKTPVPEKGSTPATPE